MGRTKPLHLRIVDQDSGEVLDGCPVCKEHEREHRRNRAIIAQLRTDKEAEARGHQLWPKAIELFDYWKRRSGHPRSRWTADRFWIVQPYIEREGYGDCRLAIDGLLGSDFHAKRGRHANRDGSVFDEFERPFESQRNFERFRDLAPRDAKTAEFFDWLEDWQRKTDAAFKAWADSDIHVQLALKEWEERS